LHEVLLAAEDGTWPGALWRAVEDAGFPLALVPEGAGGSGLPVAEAFRLVRVAAMYSAPIPLAETMLAACLLADGAIPVPQGPLSIAPTNRGDRVVLARRDNGWHLSGTVTRVPWARRAAGLVVVLEEGNRKVAVLAKPGAGTVTPGTNLAAEPRDDVAFDIDLPQEAVAPLVSDFDLRAWGAALRTAQIAGALNQILETTVRYAGERSQFGRPIGKFQAVQQNLAVLAGQVAAATAAADIAADAIATTGDALAIASAKLRAGEAAGIGAAIAHQVHGAIGFTQEYGLHFSTRRLWSWRDEFGSESEWASLIGTRVAAEGADRLWATITNI